MNFRTLFISCASFLSILFFNFNAHAQCSVDALPNNISIICGDSLELSAFGNSGNVVLNNDFNNGTVGAGWSGTPSVNFTNPCGPGPDGTIHLWMDNTIPHPRILTTISFDLTLGGSICFDMRYSTQGDAAPCEGPDLPDEGVHLQYSANGNPWVDINYFDPVGGFDPVLTTWNNYCFNIPTAAMTANTMIRWFQDGSSGSDFDHWGIDNAQIILNDPSYYYVWTHNGYIGKDPPAVHPRSDSTFTVIYTNGVNDSCQGSAVVTVLAPTIRAEPGDDTTVCTPCVDLNAFAEVIVSPAKQATFLNNAGTAINPLGIPTIIDINVAGLNMTTIQTNTIVEVCANVNNPPLFPLDVSTLTLTLVCPSGNQLVLIPNGVTTGQAYTNTCFTLAATIPAASGTPPYTGFFQPSGGSLNNMTGCTANGIWQLVINNTDFLAFGLFNSWSISFDDPEITSPAMFSWSPTTNMTNSNTLTPTVCPPGNETYTLTVWDANNCTTAVNDIHVIVDTSLVCCGLKINTVNVQDATCGANDGIIQILHTGAIGAVQYSIDSGSNFQGGAVFNNLSAGAYKVYIKDADACIDVSTVVVSGGGNFSLSTVKTDISCNGLTNGVATITPSGGTAPYSYQWDANAGGQTSASVSNLSAGTYSVTVEESGSGGSGVFWSEDFGTGCSIGNLASSYSGANGAWTVVNTGSTAAEANNWFVSATESGTGVGNCPDGCINDLLLNNRTLHIGIDDGLFVNDQGATYNTGGTCLPFLPIQCVTTNRRVETPVINCSGYSGIQLDFNYLEEGDGNTDNGSLWYYNGSAWSILDNLAKTTSGCSGTGSWMAFSIALPVSADNNPNVKIGFNWDNNDDGNGGNISFAADDIKLTGSGGGGGCPVISSVTITEPAQLTATSSSLNQNCGQVDGAIGANATGGSPAYSYQWSNAATTKNVIGVIAGNYNVTVTDSKGCQATSSVTVGLGTPSGPPGVWTWTGIVDSNWFEVCNWDKISLPDTSSHVVIPGTTTHQPWIFADTGYCKDLTTYWINGAEVSYHTSSGGFLFKQP